MRRITLASLALLCTSAACTVSTNDGDGEMNGTGGNAGSGGAVSSGGSAGSGNSNGGAGANGSGGSVSSSGGSSGAGGSSGTGGSDTGSGGSAAGAAGAGGVDNGTAGSAGDDGMGGSAGDDGTAGSAGDDGMAGSGGEGGTASGPRGLIVHYAFNENTGTTSADATENFGAAQLENGATWTEGRSGSAVELPLQDAAVPQAFVTIPAGIFDEVNEATIATWVSMTEKRPWSRIFDVGGAQGFLYLASARHAPPDSGMRFSIYPGDAADEGIVATQGELPLNVWKHVAITVQGSTYSMFIDGHRVESTTTAATPPSGIGASRAGWLGKSTFDADAYFKGKFDDFRVYDQVLSQSAIADLAWPKHDYTALRFDESSGTTVLDSSDRGFNGSTHNGPSWVPGRIGGALDLANAEAGANQHVSFAPALLADCDDLTIAMWVKLKTVTPWSRFFDIDGGVNGFLYFTPSASIEGSTRLLFNIYEGADQAISGTYPEGTVLADTWHHYAVTLSGDVGRLYFDGQEIGRNEAFTYDPSDLLYGENAHAWIGRSMFGDAYLNATLDETRISCRAYTPDEIRQLAR